MSALSLEGENRRRVADNVRFITGSGIPTNGTSGTGAGYAGPSSLYFDITNSILYVNTGTINSPTYTVLGISNIANGAIITAMLADLAVTTAKLNDLSVSTGKIIDQAVTAPKIATDTITATQIAPNAIGASELADNAVDTAAIVALAVTGAKIAANTITPTNVVTSQFAQAIGTISSANITGTGVGQLGHANGFPIIAAPGLHNIIELISVIWFYAFATAAYGAGGNVTVNRAAGAGALTGLISNANSFAAVANKAGLFLPLTTAGINLTENEGVNLVSSVAFTQPGTAAGVIRYVANYRIHATGF